MKHLWFLSVFVLNFLFSQEIERISIAKEKGEITLFPNISGVFDGTIFIEKLGSLKGIECNPLQVISYEISYPVGAGIKNYQISSNLIPDSLILEIRKSCLNEAVFFTNIKAKNDKNEVFLLHNMQLIPILNEN